MAELEMLRVDVFTDELYMGNPVNIVPEADSVDDVQMLRIASELGSPPTAFAVRSRKADVRLRFFTPFGEEPLCGHATIGALWCLAERKAFGEASSGRRRLETQIGVLPFAVEGSPGSPQMVWMTQKRPLFASEGDEKEVASALGVGVDSLFTDRFPLSRASTGMPCLLVPIRSIDAIGRLEPKAEELAVLSRELDVAGIMAYSWGVLEEGSTVHARFFSPPPLPLEDPASGLPAGALGAFLAEKDFVSKEKFGDMVVEQGHWLGRPSKIHVRVEKRSGSIRRVEVGGSARTSFVARINTP